MKKSFVLFGLILISISISFTGCGSNLQPFNIKKLQTTQTEIELQSSLNLFISEQAGVYSSEDSCVGGEFNIPDYKKNHKYCYRVIDDSIKRLDYSSCSSYGSALGWKKIDCSFIQKDEMALFDRINTLEYNMINNFPTEIQQYNDFIKLYNESLDEYNNFIKTYTPTIDGLSTDKIVGNYTITKIIPSKEAIFKYIRYKKISKDMILNYFKVGIQFKNRFDSKYITYDFPLLKNLKIQPVQLKANLIPKIFNIENNDLLITIKNFNDNSYKTVTPISFTNKTDKYIKIKAATLYKYNRVFDTQSEILLAPLTTKDELIATGIEDFIQLNTTKDTYTFGLSALYDNEIEKDKTLILRKNYSISDY